MLFDKKSRGVSSQPTPTTKDFAIAAATAVVKAGCPEAVIANKAGKIAKDVSKSLLKEGLKTLAKNTIKAAKGDEEYRL